MNSYNFAFHQFFSEVNEKQIGWFELHLLPLSRTSLGDGANEKWNKRRLVTACSRPACRCLDIWDLRVKEVSIKHNRKLGSYVHTYAWPNKLKIYIKGKLLFQFWILSFTLSVSMQWCQTSYKIFGFILTDYNCVHLSPENLLGSGQQLVQSLTTAPSMENQCGVLQ